ncbi:MAG: hypothetical protein WAV47_18985 [Blastocatellia bacterium]
MGASETVSYASLGLSPCFGDNVAFLECYLDESFRGRDELIVAGFVAPVDKWAEFATRWKEKLDLCGLPYIRLQSFLSARGTLNLSRIQRALLLDSLSDLVVNTVDFAVCSRISPREYESLATPAVRSEVGSAYALAVQGCCLAVAEYFKYRGDSESSFSVYLEAGHRNTKGALGILQELVKQHAAYQEREECPIGWPVTEIGERAQPPPMPIRAAAVGNKRDMLPLQAADLIAHASLATAKASSGLAFAHFAKLLHVNVDWTRERILWALDAVATEKAYQAERRKAVHHFGNILYGLGLEKEHTGDGGLRVYVPTGITPSDLRRLKERYPEAAIEVKITLQNTSATFPFSVENGESKR